MTEAERQAIESAVESARAELDAFEERVRWMQIDELYALAKPVHEAALGIWTTIVAILRAQHGLTREQSDEINLDELFGQEKANG